MHKHQMEKQEKMREEIADYQRQLQEAEKRHQTLLLDTNKKVKVEFGTWGSWRLCVDHSQETFVLQEGQRAA